MAYLSNTVHTPTAGIVITAIEGLFMDIKNYRLYLKTVSELQSLPNATLIDLGLSRAGIKASAKEAVYG